MNPNLSTADYFIPGSIIHIENYLFSDGQVRNKYLMVVCPSSRSSTCLASFTTTQVKVPEGFRNHGCHKKEEAALGHYVFEEGRIIGDNDFSFSRRTYVLFQSNFTAMPHHHFDAYNAVGALSTCCNLRTDEFLSLLECYRGSIHVKQRDKPLIEKMINDIKALG